MKKLVLILIVLISFGLKAQVVTTTSGKVVNLVPFPRTGLSELLTRFIGHQYNYFEVNEEMFKAFCELETADSSTIALFKKVKSVKMLELVRTQKEQKLFDQGKLENEPWDSQFYTSVTSQLDTTGYTRLLKSKTYHSLALLLKKEYSPADNEFLLITDRMVIDIRGDIKIKTIYEMEEMMGYVAQILPQ